MKKKYLFKMKNHVLNELNNFCIILYDNIHI